MKERKPLKIAMVLPPKSFLYELNAEFASFDYKILVNEIEPDCDVLIGWSISQMPLIKELHEKCPNVPMIQYNWDVYEWTRTQPRGYDWDGYADLCRISLESWVPSKEVADRMEEYYDYSSNYVIHTFARFWEIGRWDEITDGRFVLNPLRDQPDRNLHWFEKVCEEMDIPYMSPNHNLNEDEFKKAIQNCSFVVCPFYEASTGGLSLLEAYHHGKPVLLSDSPYMGGKEYFGDKAVYFKHDSQQDLGLKIREMWKNPIKLDIDECREHTAKFTPRVMAEKIMDRLEEIL